MTLGQMGCSQVRFVLEMLKPQQLCHRLYPSNNDGDYLEDFRQSRNVVFSKISAVIYYCVFTMVDAAGNKLNL